MDQILTQPGYVLFVLTFIGLSVLSIVRPSVIADWAKSSHPEFAGDEAQLVEDCEIDRCRGRSAFTLFRCTHHSGALA